jgi:hypothetical protein
MLGLPTDGLHTITPSGGKHFFFWTDRPLKSPRGIMPGIDIRCEAGQVVAPGSTINGKPYTKVDGDILELPDWMAGLIEQGTKKHRKVEDRTPLVEWDKPENIRRAIDYLENHACEASYGSRNDTIFKVGARVKDFGVSKTENKALLLEHYFEHKCPLLDSEDELDATLSSVYRNGLLPPGIDDPKGELGDVSAELSSLETTGNTTDYTWLAPKALNPDFDSAKIPPRDWIVPELLARRFVSGLISPGGVGKTQWGSSLSIAIPANRSDICGFQIKVPGRVWYWNQEDDMNELNRRFGATMQKFNVNRRDVAGKLFINSGVDHPLLLAKRKIDRSLVEAAEVERVIAFIKENKIDVFIVDPLVEFHEGEENDNVQMRKVTAIARRIAVEGNCAVLIVAHTKKPPQAAADSYAGDIDALRGAGAQGNVMRIAYTLFGMSKKEAKRWGVREDEAHLYVRMDDAKANLFLKKDQPKWFKRVSVQLGGRGETIGVLEPAKLEQAKASDVPELIAKTIAAGSGFERRKFYSLSELVEKMTVSERAVFGANGSNRSRLVTDTLKGQPGWVATSPTEFSGVTCYGRLTVQIKQGRGGTKVRLDNESLAPKSEDSCEQQQSR